MVRYFCLFFFFFGFSQESTFKDYNQKIAGIDFNLEMVALPSGTFKMGSPNFEKNRLADEGPVHEVYIDSFWIGKFEITWDLYQLFMQREIDSKKIKNGNDINVDVDAVTSATTPYVDMTFGMGSNGYPAISMTQLAASKFCEWLSAMTGNYYRLPTEAEWEYACRAGSESAYGFGNDVNELADYAWYDYNSGGKYQKVGSKKPNNWGLHDMHGNVAEWTLDQYSPRSYYSYVNQIADNPYNRAQKLYPRVVRGGSWMSSDYRLRSSSRTPSNKNWKKQDPQIPKSRWWHTDAQFLGFRIVRPYKVPDNYKDFWIQ
ncbi:MAG: formylglycine-generating enzyme family protein [Flavobacteriaceae bacterium]